MKKIILIALVLLMLVPSSMAQLDPYKMLTGQQMIGSYSGTATSYGPWWGDNCKSWIGAGKVGYLEYLTSSGKITIGGKNVAILQNLAVTGTITAGATVNSGTIGTSALMGAGYSFGAATGGGAFSWANSTGAFDTSTGTVTSNGNFVVTGSKTTTTGTGAVQLLGNTWMPSAKSLNLAGAANIGGLATVNTFKSNGTSILTGVTSIGITNQTAGYIRANTTLYSGTVKPFYWLKPANAHTGLVVTLPPAAEMNNATLEFSTELAVTNSCTIVLDGAASETINGAATKYATALYSSIRIKSDGTGWNILSSSQTWT